MKQKIGLFCVVLSLAAMPGCIDVKMSDVEKLFKQETESAGKGNESAEAVADTIVMISEEESDHLFFKGVRTARQSCRGILLDSRLAW